MNALQFNSFAQSPKSKSAKPSQFKTQLSLNHISQQSPYSNILYLKKQQQVGINSYRSSSTALKKSSYKYLDQISLMKSNISLLTNPQIQYNLPLSVYQLQVGLTQEILSLRQDKLTLMQQQNRIIQSKYRIQRQITKLRKNKQKQIQLANKNSVFDKQNSNQNRKNMNDQIIIKNENLKKEQQNLKRQRQAIIDQLEKQDQQLILIQIENVQQNSRMILQKINKIQDNRRKGEESRFETFFPQKYKDSSIQKQRQTFQLKQLHQRRAILYKKLADKASIGQRSYLLQLVDQNQEFFKKINNIVNNMEVLIINNTHLNIQYLRQKVEEEKTAKQQFFYDLRKFKEQSKQYRKANQQMKTMLLV